MPLYDTSSHSVTDQILELEKEIEFLEEQRQFCYDPTRQIAIVWDITDVMHVRSDLNAYQSLMVLRDIDNWHNPDVGVTWTTIRETAERMFPKTKG